MQDSARKKRVRISNSNAQGRRSNLYSKPGNVPCKWTRDCHSRVWELCTNVNLYMFGQHMRSQEAVKFLSFSISARCTHDQIVKGQVCTVTSAFYEPVYSKCARRQIVSKAAANLYIHAVFSLRTTLVSQYTRVDSRVCSRRSCFVGFGQTRIGQCIRSRVHATHSPVSPQAFVQAEVGTKNIRERKQLTHFVELYLLSSKESAFTRCQYINTTLSQAAELCVANLHHPRA